MSYEVVTSVGGEDVERRNLALVDAIAEYAPDATVAVDDSGIVMFLNGRAADLFGYARGEIVGGYVQRLLPDGDAAPSPRGRCRDGTEFPAEISRSVVPTRGGDVTLVAVRDVTERVRADEERAELEARLVRERAAAQASRMESVGQLAGGVAHDFNNLLSVIIGSADFLSERLPEGPDRDELEEIRRAAQQAAGLTRQLLTFSRRDVVEPQVVDVNAVVRDVERLLGRTLGEHVELVTRLTPDPPPVLADPGSLEQILVNLAVNARDAMPRGGTLTTATSLVTLGAGDLAAWPNLEPGRHVCLRVSDTGEGMTSGVMRRATEPFFSTKPKGKGTGLGLATVFSIVRSAGGDMAFASPPGEGTTVSICFPAVTGAVGAVGAAAAPSDPPRSASGSGRHVLLVEDDDAVRRIATRILDRNGYAVTGVGGGAAALAALAGADPPVEILLTDVVMPEMPGPDLAVLVRDAAPDLPVVFMSGYVDPMIDMGRVPDAALVHKPFTEASLTAALHEALAARAR